MLRHQLPPHTSFILFILLFIFSIPLHAATFTVTNLNDSGPGSLRQAVLDANASLTSTHTIEFQPGLTGTITLVNGEIAIVGRMTINGPGENVLAISGNKTSRVFNVTSLGATIRGLTIKEGATSSHGGGISNTGYLTLNQVTLSDNEALSGYGGGIYTAGFLTLTDVTVSNNTVRGYGYGGGIYNSGSLNTVRLTVTDNTGYYGGGGIFFDSNQTATLTDSVVNSNQASQGGGIYFSGTATITNTVIDGNQASNGDGGGIYAGSGTITVTNSTLSNNGSLGSGGGIHANSGTITVTNSTLSGNLANSLCGGIYTSGSSDVTVTNSTITANLATQAGGGICGSTSGFNLRNSIVAGNTALNGKEIYGGYSAESSSNLFGENGVSGVEGATPSPSEIIAGPLSSVIGPLANNGGSTQTHALVAGSPAIDKGNNSLIPAGVTTDQRNQPRIQNGTVDIGAVEGTGDNVTTYALTVSKSGGNGTITSNPAGINCGAVCTSNFNSGTSVTLTANPDSGYSFNGWSGDCSGTNNNLCTVTMDRAKSVTALFSNQPLNTYTLTVSKAGNGSGTVTSSPSGINCGIDCSESYAANTLVTLTAKPSSFDVKPLSTDSEQVFAGWSGACSGTNPSCTVTMNAAKSVTATFNIQGTTPDTYALTLTTAGPGSGTVNGAGNYAPGAMVMLTATANTGSTFAGWSPTPCASLFSMPPNPLACTATFTDPTGGYPLNVALAGTGVGSIASQPSGISCSNLPGAIPDCSETYPANTLVTLTATPGVGPHYFQGWSGACSGTSACTVTMSAAKSVTATFATGYALTLTYNPDGSIARDPVGSNCTFASATGDLQCIYAPNTVVTLSAVPAGGTFTGWGGGSCTGAGDCQLTMTGNKTVSASFTIGDPISQLITHYYVSITERAPDLDGLAFWKKLADEKQAQGADVKEVFRQIADFFFNSEEYLGRNTTDRQFITNLYRTFFQRTPDDEGYAFWLGQLASGMTRNTAMRGFLYSPEFTDFMERTLNR